MGRVVAEIAGLAFVLVLLIGGVFPGDPGLALTSMAGETDDKGGSWLRDAGAVTEDAVDGMFEQSGDFVDDGADGSGAGGS